MTRPVATVLGAVFWFLAAPGTVCGLLPWLLTGWRAQDLHVVTLPARVVGAGLVLGGLVVVVEAFVRFVVSGLGTPIPVAPPQRLVVTGFYRFVRNPMYVGVEAAILGQALILGRPVLLAHAAAVAVVVTMFVRLYEEPELERRFGTDYDRYRRHVRRWWPRLRPWAQ